MKIYGGEYEILIDVWSMVVKTDQGSWMKIYGSESEMPIDVWSMVMRITETKGMP